MEYISYQTISKNTTNLNSASYLNSNDYSLMTKDFIGDLWYGSSINDVIELGVFDYSQKFVGWNIIERNNAYKISNYSYLNSLDFPVEYSYSELLSNFIIHKNDKILTSPPQELTSSFGISNGSYILTYNFIRNMAGDVGSPLVIKDISPSKKEIKLIPLGGSTAHYDAFCRKKVLIDDISPLYITSLDGCPYGQIYNNVYSTYTSEINTLKSLFFLTSEGDVVTFFKNLYEDLVTYTRASTDASGNVTVDPERILRIQGIRSDFNNYLMSNVNKISDFSTLDKTFHSIVDNTIETKFAPLGSNLTIEHIAAKKFIHDFFTKYFYDQISQLFKTTYNEKYFSYLKNAINLGNGRLLPIITHDFLDERTNIEDPLTLIVKLQTEIPSDIVKRTNCWISNISLVPYVINTIIKTPGTLKTTKIGNPNFSANVINSNVGSSNTSYTGNELNNDQSIDRELSVSRKQAELNIDYTDFNKFVIFSSAELRLTIFKNKVISLNTLTSSLQSLEALASSFLISSGSVYPYYSQEHEAIQTKLDNIVAGFDGYESYLYRSGIYEYESGSFVSSSYISELDSSGSYYDKYNRDSLINNTPQHIIVDEGNDDYIIFLSMMGHYFDDLYAYIASIPTEKSIAEGADGTFTRTVIDYMLDSFGWNSEDLLDQGTLVDNFLNADQISGLNTLSSEERIKEIRNRILITLPKIYKTKGTDAAVKLILSCYGIPSTLLNVREYGGVNYESENASYTQYEKIFMYQWDTSSKYNFLSAEYPGKTKTIEYKFSIPSADPYRYNSEQIQWGVIPSLAATEVSGSGASGSGLLHGGFVRERGKNLGRVFFSHGYQGHENFKIYSDIIPIFDGNVYSVMVRRNDYDSNYEAGSNENEVPTKYDLYVGRNSGGRKIIYSTSSYINYVSQSNYTFDTSSNLMIGGWFHDINGQGYTGTLDKFMVWIDPITDENFQDHVNNPNSYAFSGSREPHKSLILRMHTDYPFNLRTISPGSDRSYITNSPDWMGTFKNANPYYANENTAFANYANETYLPSSLTNKISYFVCYAPWSGSRELVYNTASCQNVSQSCYPYQFAAIDYPCTYTISKYGPNKFRNEKIKHIDQSLDVRLDSDSRSTNIQHTTSPDSNIIGFFADPNDFKNKDIVRYFGNYNFMDAIGDTSNSFSQSYSSLKLLRKQYANYLNWDSGSNPRINEMMTMYKLYFNRSIFSTIENLFPARNNILTGVVIEPSLLERPKYQAKPVSSEVNSGSAYYFDVTASKYFRDPDTRMVKISETPLYSDFNLDVTLLSGSYFNSDTIPSNLLIDLNFSYINNPSIKYPINYLKNGTEVCDLPDKYQLGHFGSNAHMPVDDENLTGKTSFDMIHELNASGSQKYYLVKKWNNYTISHKSGNWIRTSSPVENTYVTNSVQLYEYVLLPEAFFKSLVYEELTEDTTTSEVLSATDVTKFVHYPNTFRNNPNTTFNNISVTQRQQPYSPFRYEYDPVVGKQYVVGNGVFEITCGYPRNHYTHKRHIFSPHSTQQLGKDGNGNIVSKYTRSQQTISTTIGLDGLADGKPPIQTFEVGNINFIQADNVINQ